MKMYKIRQIEIYVKNISFELDELHNYKHFKSVADNAKLIAKAEKYDEEVAYISGLLHDIGRIRYNGKWIAETDLQHHGIISAEIAREFLHKLKYEDNKINLICEAISTHVRPKKQKTKLAKILWDADKLTFYKKENQESLINYLVKRGMGRQESENRIRYDWSFYYGLFYTTTAKKIAYDYLVSIKEKLITPISLDWKPPELLKNNEISFNDIQKTEMHKIKS